MNVVINTRPLTKHPQICQSNFIKKCLLKIIHTNPEHSFFFIADGIADKGLVSKNSSIIAAAPKSANSLLWKIWYSYKLPSLLKKYKADVFVNIDSICSLKTNVPQCLVVPNLSMPGDSSFYKKNTAAFFKKVSLIITFSQFVKNEICKTYKVATEKVEVIYTGAYDFFLPDNEKENIKERYTEGKEYFLFTGEINTANNLVNLLKAFSFFKKRQKSNMQLIIATTTISPNNAFIKSLNSYKYRNDVKLMVDMQEEELVKIIATAYAFVYATEQNGFYVPLLQAMQCGIPVIVSNTLLMNEICGDAALFTDPTIFENIADKMMLVFKDENRRNELIIKGKKQAAQFPLTLTNQSLWRSIVKCAGISVNTTTNTLSLPT